MLKLIITSAFAASLLVAVTSPAQAQVSEVPTVKISVAGIDANSDSGARIILQRIHNAAAKVCGGVPNRPLDRLLKFEPCVQGVTQNTVARLSNPRLTAMLGGKAASPSATELASTR